MCVNCLFIINEAYCTCIREGHVHRYIAHVKLYMCQLTGPCRGEKLTDLDTWTTINSIGQPAGPTAKVHAHCIFGDGLGMMSSLYYITRPQACIIHVTDDPVN